MITFPQKTNFIIEYDTQTRITLDVHLGKKYIMAESMTKLSWLVLLSKQEYCYIRLSAKDWGYLKHPEKVSDYVCL